MDFKGPNHTLTPAFTTIVGNILQSMENTIHIKDSYKVCQSLQKSEIVLAIFNAAIVTFASFQYKNRFTGA